MCSLTGSTVLLLEKILSQSVGAASAAAAVDNTLQASGPPLYITFLCVCVCLLTRNTVPPLGKTPSQSAEAALAAAAVENTLQAFGPPLYITFLCVFAFSHGNKVTKP